MANWYAIRTATRREFDAVEELTRAGVPCYVPSDTHDRKLKGDVQPFDRPRYPGYGFVCCDGAEQLDDVRGARFVHEVLRYIDRHGDPRPLQVPSEIVATLFRAQWEGRFDRRSVDYIPTRGDKVRLTQGKLAALGHWYEVISVSADKRRALISRGTWKIEEEVAHLIAAA
jgi:hypothetical protein